MTFIVRGLLPTVRIVQVVPQATPWRLLVKTSQGIMRKTAPINKRRPHPNGTLSLTPTPTLSLALTLTLALALAQP